MNKIGLVLEGGGIRGIFTAGVLDFFLDKGIRFDYVVGVSAGSCNGMGYLVRKRNFMKDCVINETGRDAFFGIAQMADSHKLIDLDKVFDDYAEKYDFDYNKLLNSRTPWEFVVSNVETGKAEYKSEKVDIKRAKQIGKASCSLPILSSPRELDGNLYLDGGVCDSIPLKHAQEWGCKYNVVIATRRKGIYPHLSEVEKPAVKSLYGKKYPNFLEAIYNREQEYINVSNYIDEQVDARTTFVIRPTLPETGRLETDISKISLAYYHGYTKAEEVYKDLLKFMIRAKNRTLIDFVNSKLDRNH